MKKTRLILIVAFWLGSVLTVWCQEIVFDEFFNTNYYRDIDEYIKTVLQSDGFEEWTLMLVAR